MITANDGPSGAEAPVFKGFFGTAEAVPLRKTKVIAQTLKAVP